MTFFPSPVGPVLSVYSYDSAASALDKLASELSSAIESSDGGYNYPLDSLHYGLLDQLQSPAISLLYRRMSSSASVQQRILGLSGSIRQGNTPALLSATQEASTFAAYPMEGGILLLSIRDCFRTANAESIAALGQSAAGFTNLGLPFRQATAHALAAIHTAETLPYLVVLLDDSDATLRMEAIGGMGAFANGLPVNTAAGNPGLAHLQIPASAPYKTAETIANFAMGAQAINRRESRYLSFWKGWWVQNRTRLGY